MRSICALVLLSGMAIPLSAQATRDTVRVDSTRVARQFEIAGISVSVPRPALTTGGSSAVEVRLDSIRSLPAPTMEEVLRAMPLLVIRQNSRGEAQPAIRGSEERQIGIFMDGVPLTLGWDHRSDLSIIPLTAAQSVRLVRGLSSVLYGPNTLGGVVEVDVARVPGRIESVKPVDVGVSLDQTGATNVSASGAHLVEGSGGQWIFRAGTGFQDRPGHTLPDGVFGDPTLRDRFLVDGDDLRLNSDSRRVDGFLAGRYRGDSGSWASFAASAYDVERGVPPEAHQDEPRLWRYPDQRRLLTAASFGTGSRRVGGGRGDLELSLGLDLASNRIDAFDSESFDTVVDREDSDTRTFTVRLEGDRTLGARGELRGSATYADISHEEVLTPGGAFDYRQRLWSFGLESEWRVGVEERTRLSLGAVLDGADTPESGDKPPLGTLTDFGIRVGASSLVGESLLLHGAASRRARFPSLRELYSGALGRFEPNPSLAAETLLGAEGGLTVMLPRDIEFQAVGFHQRLQDGIIRTSVIGSDGRRRFKRINQDEVRSTGIELLAVGSVGVATISGDLTLQHVRGVEPDGSELELEYEPAISGKFGLEGPFGRGFRAAADFRFVGSQRCENPESGRLDPIDASGSLDLSFRRIFQFRSGGALSRVDASASVRNATDAISFDQCGLPQPGRTFQLQLRLW